MIEISVTACIGFFVFLVILKRKRLPAVRMTKSLIGTLLALNGCLLAAAAFVLFTTPMFAQGQEQPGEKVEIKQEEVQASGGSRAIGAALAVGLAAIGAGLAVGMTGSAAIGATTQKPEMLGRSLVFVGLAEGIAIYGLIVAFMVMTWFGG